MVVKIIRLSNRCKLSEKQIKFQMTTSKMFDHLMHPFFKNEDAPSIYLFTFKLYFFLS